MPDRDRLAEHLGLGVRQFVRSHCARTDGHLHLKNPENDCVFLMNEAYDGGGSYNEGCLYATRCDYAMNTAANGGGHYEAFDSYMTNCRLVGNTAFGKSTAFSTKVGATVSQTAVSLVN